MKRDLILGLAIGLLLVALIWIAGVAFGQSAAGGPSPAWLTNTQLWDWTPLIAAFTAIGVIVTGIATVWQNVRIAWRQREATAQQVEAGAAVKLAGLNAELAAIKLAATQTTTVAAVREEVAAIGIQVGQVRVDLDGKLKSMIATEVAAAFARGQLAEKERQAVETAAVAAAAAVTAPKGKS